MRRTGRLSQSGDHPTMLAAVVRLTAAGHTPSRTSPYQLKCGLINFYPTRGTIHLDGGPRLNVKGLTVLLELLARPHDNLEDVVATCQANGYIAHEDVAALS